MKSRILALLALFSVLLALPVGTGLAQSEGEFEGAAVIWDDQAQSDAITYTLSNVPQPSAGTELVSWLVSDDGMTKLSTGAMELSGGAIEHAFDSDSPRYTGENLIEGYSLVVVTEEEAGSDPDQPAGQAVYHHQISLEAMPYIRNLLSDWPEGSGVGLLTTIQAQLEIARDEAMMAQREATLDGAKQRAQSALNVITGPGADHYNSAAPDPGDGAGILQHAKDLDQINLLAAIASENGDDVMGDHAALANLTAGNTVTLVELARDRIIGLVLTATTQDSAVRHLANVAGVLENALTGLDADADGVKQPIDGEAALDETYRQSQMMATYTLQVGGPPTPTPTPEPTPTPTPEPTPTPTPEPPQPGDGSVPMLTQLALLLGGALLIGAAFLFVAGRKEEGQA